MTRAYVAGEPILVQRDILSCPMEELLPPQGGDGAALDNIVGLAFRIGEEERPSVDVEFLMTELHRKADGSFVCCTSRSTFGFLPEQATEVRSS